MSAAVKRWGKRGAGVLGASLALAAIGAFWVQSEAGGAFLASKISRAASGPGLGVSIGAIEHPLSDHVVVRDVAIADDNGVWLRLDRIELDWSRLALLHRGVDIDALTLGDVHVLRSPAPSNAAPPPAATNGPLIPQLPVSLHLARLAIKAIRLDAPVLGTPATLSLDGAGRLDTTAAEMKLDARRLDHEGSFSAQAKVAPDLSSTHIAVNVSEPAGGLIARLAKVADLPPVDIQLVGDGPLDNFAARLNATLGAAIAAKGEARVIREGAARKVNLNLSGQLARLLPPDLAALFANTTTLSGAASLADDGGARLDQLALVSSAFRVDASGTLDASGKIDASGTLKPMPSAPDAAFRAGALEAQFAIRGPLAQPDVSLHALAEDIVAPFGHFGHFEANAKAVANRGTDKSTDRIDLSADVTGSRLAFADRALIDAIGDDLRATIRGRATMAGDAIFDVAKIDARAGDIAYTGAAGPNALAGKLHISSPDLAHLARLVGSNPRGALELDADLSGAPARGEIVANLSGGVVGPGIGIAAVDGLFGRKLTLSGVVKTTAQGGVSIEKLNFAGDGLSGAINGAASPAQANVGAHIDIPNLTRADQRVTGQAAVDAKLTGSLARPDAGLVVAITGASAAGRKISELTLKADGTDLTGAMKATADLNGDIDGKPARGHVNLARNDKTMVVDALDFLIGRASLRGHVTISPSGLATGNVALAAPDLDDLSALALRKLAGRLNADVTLETDGEAQNARVVAEGAGIRAPDLSLDRLNVRFSGRDVLRRPALDGEFAADNVRAGGETIASARLTAKPAGGGAALDLNVNARGFAIAGRGVLTPGDTSRLDLASFSATRGAQRIALAHPGSIAYGKGIAQLNNISLALGSGRLDIEGSAGQSLDIVARARAIPLALASLADASLKFEGAVDAEAHVTGAAASPSGDWKLSVKKFVAPQTRSNGLPAIDVSANGRLDSKRTTVDAAINFGPTSKIGILGSAPLGDGMLDLAVKGAVDAALANTMLAVGGQSARGKANIDLHVAGSTAAPLLSGAIAFADGSFTDPVNGVSLNAINARLEARGRDIAVSSFSATTRNGGKIGVTGHASITPDSGFPGAFHITARNAQLASSETVTSTADLDLDISGALAQAPRIGGKVTLLTMEVNVPDRLPANLKPLDGVTHIDPRGFARQMLDLEKKEKAKARERASRKSAFDLAMDVQVLAPNRIFVRGRGIDAELGGELTVKGSLQKPSIVGGFDLRRGKLDMLTQRISMTQGKLAFLGGLMPELAFNAETVAGDVTAKVAISGAADSPVFAFSSSPALPQDEVLSRLLFKKAAASLSPLQAVQLAAAIAQFSGGGSGIDALEKLRKTLGVDSLDVDATGSTGPKVGASKYLTNNISVGVKTGTNPAESSVNIGVDVLKGVRVQGETSMDGKSSVGVGVEFEY